MTVPPNNPTPQEPKDTLPDSLIQALRDQDAQPTLPPELDQRVLADASEVLREARIQHRSRMTWRTLKFAAPLAAAAAIALAVILPAVLEPSQKSSYPVATSDSPAPESGILQVEPTTESLSQGTNEVFDSLATLPSHVADGHMLLQRSDSAPRESGREETRLFDGQQVETADDSETNGDQRRARTAFGVVLEAEGLDQPRDLALGGSLLTHRQQAELGIETGQPEPEPLGRATEQAGAQLAVGPSQPASILDAFALARALDANAPLNPAWDITADGRINQADVDALAARAVQLAEEPSS